MELILSPDTELYPALAGSAAERDYHPEIAITVPGIGTKTCAYADPVHVGGVYVFPNSFRHISGIQDVNAATEVFWPSGTGSLLAMPSVEHAVPCIN